MNHASTRIKDEMLAYMAGLNLDLYLVGGSVRDELLGHLSADLDFVVLGIDEETALRSLRRHGRAWVTGESFGVIRFRPRRYPGAELEIALPRKEFSTGPHHRDFTVDHGGHITLKEDLERRDFTVNAIAHNLATGELVDLFGGAEDLRQRRLRLVNPRAFAEDPLRVLRGFQMISRFNLRPTAATTKAIGESAAQLATISGERKRVEMEKLLRGPHRRTALLLMRDTGVLPYVLPRLAQSVDVEQNYYHAYDVYRHCVEVCANVDTNDLDLLWAALLHDVGKPHARFLGEDGHYHFYADPRDPEARGHEEHGEELAVAELKELRLPRKSIETVRVLVREHGFAVEKPTHRRARRLLHRVGEENIEHLLLLKEADQFGSGKITTPERQQRMHDLRKLRSLINTTIAEAHAFKLSDLRVSGTDLMAAGIPEGPRVGQALRHLLELAVENPVVNQRDKLLKEALTFDRAQEP